MLKFIYPTYRLFISEFKRAAKYFTKSSWKVSNILNTWKRENFQSSYKSNLSCNVSFKLIPWLIEPEVQWHIYKGSTTILFCIYFHICDFYHFFWKIVFISSKQVLWILIFIFVIFNYVLFPFLANLKNYAKTSRPHL